MWCLYCRERKAKVRIERIRNIRIQGGRVLTIDEDGMPPSRGWPYKFKKK